MTLIQLLLATNMKIIVLIVFVFLGFAHGNGK